jgi:hypothetical protein
MRQQQREHPSLHDEARPPAAILVAAATKIAAGL